MSKVLVKFNSNWADEIDIESITIMTIGELKKLTHMVNSVPYPIEESIGSNQWLDFHSPEDVLNCLTIKDISEEEEEIIRKVLGLEEWQNSFGLYDCSIMIEWDQYHD